MSGIRCKKKKNLASMAEMKLNLDEKHEKQFEKALVDEENMIKTSLKKKKKVFC